MRSAVVLRVALSLLAVDSVVAGPCRPTSAVSSTASVDTSSATSVESATSVTSASSSATSKASAETSASSTATETSASLTETTAFTTTTAASTTVSTSTAAAPTFTLAAAGQGPVEGKKLLSYNADGNLVTFDSPNPLKVPTARPYSIDAQGRILNDQGFYLCAHYKPDNDFLDAPAYITTCLNDNLPNSVYLTCRVDGSELKCSIPAVTCTDSGSPWISPACVSADGEWGSFYTYIMGPGYVLLRVCCKPGTRFQRNEFLKCDDYFLYL
ncbi:uncharacterized protein NECHADRAFT_98359 [Fusarium vanettenii 77-13-4]|uniref:Ig-like domain-containing protein n=1 Tax=Fusarium vanettenii (strain ATCC MYA-4622 / CBS 123669 / FGSC 9596 / NRRL 45880 / 77-13-4) TaxID=660122 RepID=C7ZQJ6_FUSV7|nr:uncharacterized protein NECHADRAFT_98359 [Fusarium vanettenii 77-13-4]EEU33706.1 hypothetical protein NECHADRAFT_98359 [Fusarium vanettenii 77-13-4]